MLCDCEGISCTWRLISVGTWFSGPNVGRHNLYWELVRTGGSSNGRKPCLAKNFCYCDAPPPVTEDMFPGDIRVSSCYYGGPSAACPPCVDNDNGPYLPQ